MHQHAHVGQGARSDLEIGQATSAGPSGEYVLIVVVDREADDVVGLHGVERRLHGVGHRQGHGGGLALALPAKDPAARDDVIDLGRAEQVGRQVARREAGLESAVVVIGRPEVAFATPVGQHRDFVEPHVGTDMGPPRVSAMNGVDQG